MRLLLAFIILIAGQSVAKAEPGKILSGSYAGYTQLVLYLPPETTWTLRQEGSDAILATSPPATFDFSNVFDQIPRARLMDIRSGAIPGQTILTLGCDCALETKELVGDALVLDLIGDAPAPQPIAAPASETDTTPDVATIETARRLTEEMTRPMGGASDLPDLDRSLRLAEVEDEILQQIARASTQGLLVPQLPQPEKKAVDPSNPDLAEDTPDSPPPLPAPPGALTHSSLIRSNDLRPDLTADGLPCLPDTALAMTEWAGTEGFATGLGKLRSAMTGEFDKTSDKAVRDLSRFYLAHGFGAEAAAVLTFRKKNKDEDAQLHSIARILERGFDPQPSPFAGQEDCDTAAALWAVLATPSLAPGAVPNTPAILRALNALPKPLRDPLGILAADRFRAAGSPDIARAVLRVVDRAGPGAGEQKKLVEGQLDLDHGDTKAGREALEDTAGKDREPSPKAVLALIEHDLDRGQPVPAEVAELVSAYAFQYRTAPIAVELRAAEVLARASAGQFDPAFALLNQPDAPDLYGDQYGNLRSRTVGFLTDIASDDTFLPIALREMTNHIGDLSIQTKMGLATRFLELGFPDLAETALADTDADQTDMAVLVLRARAALGQGRPLKALEHLAETNTPDAAALRAEALAMTGDHQQASQAFANLNAPARAAQQAWLAGDWAAVQTAENDPNASAATLMTTAPYARQPGEGELAGGRRLLQDSATARATLEGLLSRSAMGDLPTN